MNGVARGRQVRATPDGLAYALLEHSIMLKSLQDCGETVLRINQSAFDAEADVFQQQVLQEFDQRIGFDRAWWGIMSPAAGGFALLSSYRANLPDSYVEKWRMCTSDDRLAISVNGRPTRTVRFGTQELHSTKGLYEINADVGNKHALCTAIKLPNRGDDFLFISLFRGGRSPAFDRSEAWSKEFLMPHVFMGWRHNLVRNQDGASRAGGTIILRASAYVDLALSGVMDAPPAFVALMNRIWPTWTAPKLPAALTHALRTAADQSTIIDDLAFSLAPSAGLHLLSICGVSPLHKLTPRETDVATAFSSGQSYKEVARSLDIAPATVRHYLREIYAKLDLTDKAGLVHLVNRSSGI